MNLQNINSVPPIQTHFQSLEKGTPGQRDSMGEKKPRARFDESLGNPPHPECQGEFLPTHSNPPIKNGKFSLNFFWSHFLAYIQYSISEGKLTLEFSRRNYFYPNTLDFGLNLNEDDWPLRDRSSSSSSSPSSSGCSRSLKEGVVWMIWVRKRILLSLGFTRPPELPEALRPGSFALPPPHPSAKWWWWWWW